MATTHRPHDCRDDDGNCTARLDHDGHVVQCLRPWALEKYHYLRQYLGATREVRRQFNDNGRRAGTGYIELFSSNGRGWIVNTETPIDGSAMIAVNEARHPFTNIVLSELCDVNVAALRARTNHNPRVEVVPGDCNETIRQVVERRLLPWWSYNVAFIDPYAPGALSFDTVAQLAAYPRMDLILHFPLGALRRNWDRPRSASRFTGEELEFGSPNEVSGMMRDYRQRLTRFGYAHHDIEVRAPAILNTNGTVLYHLMFASKHERGDEIWNKITRTDARSGQLNLL